MSTAVPATRSCATAASASFASARANVVTRGARPDALASESNASPSARVFEVTEVSDFSRNKQASYDIDGMSLRWIPATATVPPAPNAESAGGTTSPTGAKTIAPSSGTGGASCVPPVQSAPSSSASARCEASRVAT